MNHFTTSAVVCLFFTIPAAIYFLPKAEKANRLLGVFWATVSFWCAFVGFQFELLNSMNPFAWGWLLHLGCIMVPVFFLHFALEFSGMLPRWNGFLISAYALAASFLVLILTSNLFTGEIIGRTDLNYPKPSLLYPLYIAAFQIWGLVGTFWIWQLRTKIPAEVRKWLYLFLGVHLVAHVGAMDNYCIMYDVRIFPLFPYGLYPICLYAIVGSISIGKLLKALQLQKIPA